MRDFIAYVTNANVCLLDNVDQSFENTSPELLNKLCHLSTGAVIALAVLYSTNARTTFSLQKHLSMTARNVPFERDDVLRRVLHLRTEPTEGTEDKTRLIRAATESRTEIWADLLLRVQNALKAHQAHHAKTYPLVSRMKEYEAYSLLCADYEGTLDEMQALWLAYTAGYREAVTTDKRAVAQHSVMARAGCEPG